DLIQSQFAERRDAEVDGHHAAEHLSFRLHFPARHHAADLLRDELLCTGDLHDEYRARHHPARRWIVRVVGKRRDAAGDGACGAAAGGKELQEDDRVMRWKGAIMGAFGAGLYLRFLCFTLSWG